MKCQLFAKDFFVFSANCEKIILFLLALLAIVLELHYLCPCNQIVFGEMRLKRILLILLACYALAVSAQPTQQKTEWNWYLDEVVDGEFVGRNDFEYYYTPSASDMEQQRNKGEVTYFLSSPVGLSAKKTCSLIDRIMASYDDIKAMGTWTDANTIYWKEFRYENNKFRFNVKRKALDDGSYYVSVVETASYYKSLGKKDKKDEQEADAKAPKAKEKKSTRHSTRSRRPVTQDDVDAADDVEADALVPADDDEVSSEPVMSDADRRRAARKSEEAKREQERLEKRRAQQERRLQEKAQKEAEKQRKAEEKKQKEEEKRLKKEAEKQQREQQRQAREEQRRAKREKAAQAPAATPAVASKYHMDDVALWLSEKYDFTQTASDGASCTMFSTAVKDVEMAKLAIKNALKGSNARMAVPWRLNSTSGDVETGYVVDDHVLVFAVGKNDDGHITMTVTEVSNDEFELFKQGLK